MTALLMERSYGYVSTRAETTTYRLEQSRTMSSKTVLEMSRFEFLKREEAELMHSKTEMEMAKAKLMGRTMLRSLMPSRTSRMVLAILTEVPKTLLLKAQ